MKYRLKMGVEIEAVPFTGENFMEIYRIVPNAWSLSAHPNEKLRISYWTEDVNGNKQFHPNVELTLGDWVVVDEAGPIIVSDLNFHRRYEIVHDTLGTPPPKTGMYESVNHSVVREGR